MSYTPPSISFTSSVSPGLNGSPFGFPSYFDLTILSSTSVAFTPTSPSGSLIDAWCLDRNVGLFTGPLPPNVYYNASLYSTAPAELGILNAAMPQLAGGLAGLNQLDSVNWLLNSYYKGTLGANGIWQNVQGAVWALIGQNPSVSLNNDLTGGNQAAITALTNQALLPVSSGGGDGYVADQSQLQYVGVVADPRLFSPAFPGVNGQTGQPLIIPVLAARLGDFVWNDLNANGLQDANEPGVNGVTVTLFRDLNNSGVYDAGDLLLGTTVTGAGPDDPSTPGSETAGYYQFNGLTPGFQYQVQFTLPNGYAFTAANQGANTAIDSNANVVTGAAPPVTLAPGEFNRSIDAGLLLLPTAKLGDWVWVDKNADGIQQAGELGLNGVTVNLRNALTNALIATTVTGVGTDDPATPGNEAVGYYEFGGLTPGLSYKVEFINPDSVGPDAYRFSPRQAGGTAATNSDGAMSDVIVLTPGEFNRTIDAGLYRPGSIHPFAYLDKNGDGTQNGGDGAFPVSPGKTFVLKDALGNVVFTGNTDASGQVHIEGLTPGTYKLSELVPAGYQYTGAQNIERTFTISSGQELVFQTGAANLEVGDGRTEVNLGVQLTWGNTQLAKLGDWVWVDKNADGIQQAGELGLNGVTVNLRNALNNAIVATTVTGAGTDDPTTPGNEAVGYYEFGGLTPGVGYKVEFISPDTVGPDAFLFSPRQAAGGTVFTNSDAAISDTVVLVSGEFNRSIDAGLYQKGSIHAFGFLDINGDGILNGGDGAFPNNPGKTFVINGPNGYTNTLTTVAGKADWVSLTPGTYTISESPVPADYQLTTTPNLRTFTVNSGEELVYTPGAAMLPQGDTRTEVNIGTQLMWGNTQLASIGDFVWLDTNGNGLQEANEAGVNGVTVRLINTLTNVVIATTTTGIGSDDGTTPGNEAAGYYQFTGLTPGVAYTVEFVKPVGSNFTTANVNANGNDNIDSDADVVTGRSQSVTLGSGEFNRSIDAGIYLPASLGDRVWQDTDGDGKQNNNEPGINGVTVRLYNCVTNALVATTTTGVAGIYNFTDLAPGSYYVEFITPAGFVRTIANVGADGFDVIDSDAATPNGTNTGFLTGCYTLNSGDNNTTVDGGFVRPASLGDRLWVDTNGDGIQNDGATGIVGQTVTLIGGGADGLINGIGDTSVNTLTGLDGFYNFTGLTPGVQYQVQFNKPAGTVFTTRDVNGNTLDTTDSDADLVTGKSAVVTLTSGEYNPTIDAGVYTPAALGDKVFEDKNANGQQDANEPGIPNATVTLFTCVNGQPGVQVGAPKLTDANGNYSFTGLVPGDYIVRFTTPNGFTQTTANVGADGTDSDATAGGLTGCYTLTSGQTDNTVDAGFYKPAALGDKVFLDANANGQQDPGEAGVPNVRVELYACVNNLPSGAMLAFQTTDANGIYGFNNLTPGNYIVKFITPAGYTLSPVDVGADGTDSDATATGFTACYTLASGQTDNTVDAGLVVVPPNPGIEIIKDANVQFVAPNTPVTFTYSVRNTGGVALSNITVKDDNATPTFADDDFNPTPVLSAGFNIGDLNKDNKLDTTEIWKYSATVIPPYDMTVSVTTGATPIASGSLSYLTLANGDVRVFYRQDKNFNDNTYGTGSDSGWTSQGKTHTFSNLTGSDKAGFDVKFADGTSLVKFYQDYISLGGTNTEGYTAFSGYQSLGLTGDGSLVSGNSAVLKDFDSTLELSMNQSGIANNGVAYTAMTVNSPVNDPKWDSVNGYYFTIDKSAFATKAFGGVVIFDQHNSPAKVGGSNSYIPMVKGGASINTAVVTGTPPSGPPVTDDDPATVIIVNGPLGSLGDRVWIDSNANGLQEATEVGIVGAKVSLTADFNGDGITDYSATTTTVADGKYTFTGLPAGTYKVSVDPTSLGGNYSQTFDLDGISTANMATTTLTTGQNRTDVDFGYVGSNPGFTLVKIADKTSVVTGGSVTYTYTVKNTTGLPISNVVLRDDNATPNQTSDDFLPVRQSGDVNSNNVLDANETWVYTATVIPPVQMTVTIGSTVYDSGTLTYTTLSNGDVRVNYLQNNNFNDNTYGTGSNWTTGTHTFSNLTGSDKAGFEVRLANGTSLVKFYQDYLTASSTQDKAIDPVTGLPTAANEYTTYSGYRSLGISGGDGSLVSGNGAVLKDFDSTLETNLNQSGTANNGTAYTAMIVNSPVGDAKWDVVNGYSFTIDKSAFTSSAFGGVTIFDQHNSPAKVGGSNTYIPTVVGGPSTNTAIVSGTWNGQQLVATGAATVNVTAGGGGGGGGTLAGSKFFVVDAGTDDVFGYTTAGAATGVGALTSANSSARGITGDAAGTKLWVLDKNDSVYVYTTAGVPLGNWVAGGLGKEPEGIALDGNNLWIVDSDKDTVGWYKNAAANLSGTDNAEFTFSLPSTIGKAAGITTNGTFVWIVQDDTANTVFRYTIAKSGSGDVTGLTNLVSWTLDTRNTTPTGITLDPTGVSQSLWVVDSGTDTVYEYAGALSRTSGSNIAATSTFKLAAANTTPEDIFDPFIGSTSADAIVANSGLSFGDMVGPARPEVRLPSMNDLLGGDTLDSVLGVSNGGRSADMSFRELIDSSASETSELLRRLTEFQRGETHMTHVLS